jgi:hypothetical protein
MRTLKFYFLVSVCCLLSVFTGCSNGNIKTNGSVSFSDGAPVVTGIVRFETPQTQYTALIQSDGTFNVNMGKGLPPGQYRVSVIDVRENETLLIDEKYENPDTSGLTFDVKLSANEPLKITVERSKTNRSLINVKRITD